MADFVAKLPLSTALAAAADVAVLTADEIPHEHALPGVHAATHRLLETLTKGSLLDLGAGEGALSYWATAAGFEVTALDVDRGMFCLRHVPFVEHDLNRPLPLAAGSADAVAAIEVIEHLEDQYGFLREIARVVKPGGDVILSTPNEHNVVNRWSYFWTGFYGDSRYVIREDDPQLGMRHINMIPLAQLELAWRRAGLELVAIEVSRYRRIAPLLAVLVYPVQALRYKLRLSRIKNAQEQALCRRVYKMLNRMDVLLGRVLVFHLKKPLV